MPVVLLAVAAMIGLALVGREQVRLTRAAAAAARVAVVRPDLARDEAIRSLSTAGSSIKPASVRVTIAPADGPPGLSALKRISVSTYYRPIAGFGWRPVFKLRSELVFSSHY